MGDVGICLHRPGTPASRATSLCLTILAWRIWEVLIGYQSHTKSLTTTRYEWRITCSILLTKLEHAMRYETYRPSQVDWPYNRYTSLQQLSLDNKMHVKIFLHIKFTFNKLFKYSFGIPVPTLPLIWITWIWRTGYTYWNFVNWRCKNFK